MIVVLSGPGGVGKGTVAKRLIEKAPDIHLSRSWTTRPCRPDEAPTAYTFVSREKFMAEVEAGKMLEWTEFNGHYYGTPTSELEPYLGIDDNFSKGGNPTEETTPLKKPVLLLEIDVKGCAQVLELYPDQIIPIFLEAPDVEAHQERLKKRGDSTEHAKARIEYGERERTEAKQLNANWVINSDVESAVNEIIEIIQSHK